MQNNSKKIATTFLIFWLVAIACFVFLSSVNSSITGAPNSCEKLHAAHLENPGDKETIFQAWEINCPFQDKNGDYLYTWTPWQSRIWAH